MKISGNEEFVNISAQIRTKCEELKSRDISHVELGVKGFKEAEDAKNSIVQFLEGIYTLVTDNEDKIDESYQRIIYTNIINNLDKLITELKKLDPLVADNSLHTSNFPAARQQFINKIIAMPETIKLAFMNYKTFLLVSGLSVDNKHEEINRIAKSEIDSGFKQIKSEIDSYQNKADSTLSESNSINSESKKILENIQNKLMENTVKINKSIFYNLSEKHMRWERFWLTVLLISSCVTVITMLNVISGIDKAIDSAREINPYLDSMRRILQIAIPSIFFKLSLSKYNIERNLNIIYSHRESVLNQYKNFENSIGDQYEQKNALRIEVARYLFSDPVTGYLGDSSKSNDVSINPVVNMAEMIAKK